jgi:hypothetical protein
MLTLLTCAEVSPCPHWRQWGHADALLSSHAEAGSQVQQVLIRWCQTHKKGGVWKGFDSAQNKDVDSLSKNVIIWTSVGQVCCRAPHSMQNGMHSALREGSLWSQEWARCLHFAFDSSGRGLNCSGTREILPPHKLLGKKDLRKNIIMFWFG